MTDAASLPFVAPCHQLEPRAPWRWLACGLADLRRAPRVERQRHAAQPARAGAVARDHCRRRGRQRLAAEVRGGHGRSMQALCVLAAALCLTVHASAAEPVTTPPTPPAAAVANGPTLLRTALIVADAERSIAFYRLLGLRVESDTGSQPRRVDGNPFPLNAPATRSRLVILGSASGAGGRIGLVEFAAPTPPARRDGAELVGRGDPVFVFDVADADAMHAALRAGGARVHGPPQGYVSARRAADGRPLRGKVFHVWDPDGYLIELLEAPK